MMATKLSLTISLRYKNLRKGKRYVNKIEKLYSNNRTTRNNYKNDVTVIKPIKKVMQLLNRFIKANN